MILSVISVKIQSANIFRDHHIAAKPQPTTACDEWPLSLGLWRKFYNSPGKYKPELNEYFHMCRCQLNFAKRNWYFLATRQLSKLDCMGCL